MALTLASAPLLVRHLGVVDFGRYVIVTTLVALVGGVTEGGLTAVAQREYVVKAGAARDALMRDLLGLRIVLTVAGLGIAVSFAAVAGYGEVLVAGTAIAGVGLLAQLLQGFLTVSLIGELRFGWATAVELLRTAIAVALVVALVVLGAGLLPLVAVTVPAGALAVGITVMLVRGSIPLRPTFRASRWWPLVKEIIPFSIATAMFAAYFRISVVLISLVTSGLQTGYFATSYRILEVFLGIPPMLVGAVYPVLARAARDDRARLSYVVRRTLEVALILGIWFLLCIELGAPLMVEVIGGSEARPAVPVLRLQGLAIVATFVAVACAFPLLSLRRHGSLLVANALALSASMTLTLALGPSFGAEGAACATVVAEVALAGTMAVMLRRSGAGWRVSKLFVARLVLAGAVAAGVIFIPHIPDLVRVSAASVIYFALLAGLGCIPVEVRDALSARRLRLRDGGQRNQ